MNFRLSSVFATSLINEKTNIPVIIAAEAPPGSKGLPKSANRINYNHNLREVCQAISQTTQLQVLEAVFPNLLKSQNGRDLAVRLRFK